MSQLVKSAPQRVRGGYVRLPVEVIERVGGSVLAAKATALAVALVLYDLQSGTSGASTMSQGRIMARLGRGERRADAVRRAVDRLRGAGLVHARREDGFVGRYRYQLTVLAGGQVRWVEVPRRVMDAMAEGLLTPATVVVWLDLDRALGRHGRTSDTDEQIAARLGCRASTVTRHLRVLVRLGFVRSRARADGGRMLHRVDLLTAGPVPADARSLTATTAPAQTPDADGSRVERGNKNASRANTKMRVLGGASLAPEKELAPEKTPSSGLPDDRHLGDASASDDAAAKDDDTRSIPPTPTQKPQERAERPSKARSTPRPGKARKALSGPARAAERVAGGGAARDERVRYVLAGIEPHYRTGVHRRWTRGVARAVLEALEGAPASTGRPRAALTPQACRWALSHLFDPEAHGERTVPAARAALALLAAETRNGLACRDCGRDDVPVHAGLCPPCTPEHTAPEHPSEADLPPLTERLAAYQALGMAAADLTGTDPAAAAALGAEATR